MSVASYRELVVWAKAMDLAAAIYEAAALMPKREEYRLTAQLIRAAISVPAIARDTRALPARRMRTFVSIARGSTAELETLLLLAERTSLLPTESTRRLIASAEEIGACSTGSTVA